MIFSLLLVSFPKNSTKLMERLINLHHFTR
nr:MAG TPA: hypothetical protein [Caudoviricetes sp.]